MSTAGNDGEVLFIMKSLIHADPVRWVRNDAVPNSSNGANTNFVIDSNSKRAVLDFVAAFKTFKTDFLQRYMTYM